MVTHPSRAEPGRREMIAYRPMKQRISATSSRQRSAATILLISPPNQPGDHLRALENISRHLKDDRFTSFLRQAKTREQVIELLDEADAGH